VEELAGDAASDDFALINFRGHDVS
jgi:hypothetical protein